MCEKAYLYTFQAAFSQKNALISMRILLSGLSLDSIFLSRRKDEPISKLAYMHTDTGSTSCQRDDFECTWTWYFAAGLKSMKISFIKHKAEALTRFIWTSNPSPIFLFMNSYHSSVSLLQCMQARLKFRQRLGLISIMHVVRNLDNNEKSLIYQAT